jgi:hypothetical protein
MFRRRIVLSSRFEASQGRTRAALEDDFHHFLVEVVSARGQVTGITAGAPRRPYTLCGEAAAQLDALLGMPLSTVAHEVTRATDPREQCTHLFELAGLAIAAAARGTVRRQYDVEVPDRVDDRTHSRIARDGIRVLEWEVAGTVIQAPERYRGVDLYHGMARWALNSLPPEEAEAALVLRRATGIAKGRGMNLDAQIHARPNGNCFAQQPQRAAAAIRIVGSTLDFASRPAALCADDRDWLSFEA